MWLEYHDFNEINKIFESKTPVLDYDAKLGEYTIILLKTGITVMEMSICVKGKLISKFEFTWIRISDGGLIDFMQGISKKYRAFLAHDVKKIRNNKIDEILGE